MAGYCTLVLYFHSPAAHENTAAHTCNIQPYCFLTHVCISFSLLYMWPHTIYIYIYIYNTCIIEKDEVSGKGSCHQGGDS